MNDEYRTPLRVKFGYVVGGLWMIFFAYRYLLDTIDRSQAITFCGLGFGLIAFSWLYNGILKRDDDLKNNAGKELKDHEKYVV